MEQINKPLLISVVSVASVIITDVFSIEPMIRFIILVTSALLAVSSLVINIIKIIKLIKNKDKDKD